jgi:hypothetical protein
LEDFDLGSHARVLMRNDVPVGNEVPPVRHANDKLPVMVWIHPGGQTSSAANDYNPERLITHGTPVIFVSFNFRLNIFAFYAHKTLTAELPQLGSGNYAGPAVVVSTNSGLVEGTTSTDGNMLIWRGSLTASENRVPNCHRPWLRGTEPAAMFTGSADKCHSGEASERRGSILRSARLG